MPAQFTALLARRLDHSCALRVVEACHDMPIRAGVAHIASGGFHLRLREGEASWVAALTREDSETECRPSVDHLFESAAAVCGSGLAAVVLTGMGRDGLAGARDVVARGGRVLIQDEASSVVWGMPGAVARHDLASFIGSPTAIAAELERCVAAGSSCALKSIAHGGPR
jgi:two-component system chemotaxis response regulator CheB